MTNTKDLAVAYYTALGAKNIKTVEKYIHPHIQFTDPKETVMGKETFLKAAKGFSTVFKSLTIRSQFGSEDQALIVYDFEIPGLSKSIVAASLLSFQEGLISKIELIYDTGCLTGLFSS